MDCVLLSLSSHSLNFILSSLTITRKNETITASVPAYECSLSYFSTKGSHCHIFSNWLLLALGISLFSLTNLSDLPLQYQAELEPIS